MKEGHSEFWPWALDRWQGPAAVRLLKLQDEHDVVILELMFVAWLGVQCRAISQDDLDQLRGGAQAWIDQVVLPLRRVRRAWKAEGKQASLRTRLQALELEAEKSLSLLYAQTWSLISATANGDTANHCEDALGHNLWLVLEGVGLQADDTLRQQLLQDLSG